MAFFDRVCDALAGASDAALKQMYNSQGFQAGANGQPPRLFFPNPPFCKTSYDEGYEKGQRVAAARAISNK